MPETLTFSTSIYRAAAIEETAAAYAELLDCELRNQENSVEVELKSKVEDIDDLADHFANLVLHLSGIQHRGTLP